MDPRSPLILLALLLAGCVLSVYPVYRDEDVVADSAVLGTWEDSASNMTAVVSQDGLTGYSVSITDDERKAASFTGRLARFGGKLVLDLAPQELPNDLSATYRGHFLPVHSFYFAHLQGARLVLVTFHPDSLSALLRRRPTAVAHVQVEDGVILTAPTLQLQAFIRRYWDEPSLLMRPTVWTRYAAAP